MTNPRIPETKAEHFQPSTDAIADDKHAVAQRLEALRIALKIKQKPIQSRIFEEKEEEYEPFITDQDMAEAKLDIGYISEKDTEIL